MSRVYFASAHVDQLSQDHTLPNKFHRLLQKYRFGSIFKDMTVAIKIHEGTGVGFTTIRPIFIRTLVEAVKKSGGKPFITGGIGWPTHSKERGYTEEVLGAPLFPGAGVTDKYLCPVETGDPTYPVVEICGNIAHADAMIVLSHAKGHGHCGFGGVIKNLGMGCVSSKARHDIHRMMDTGFDWSQDRCDRCGLCVENCPRKAISFKKDKTLSIFLHDCTYCMHCVTSCPNRAISIDMGTYKTFQKALALAMKASLRGFAKSKLLYINVAMDITPLCDCWGFSSPPILPDIGIFAAKDPIALEQATLDSMDAKNLIPGSLPKSLPLSKKRKAHLWERIHNKNPYIQIEEAAKLGLGSVDYQLIEVQ